jgi:hypothetical protein
MQKRLGVLAAVIFSASCSGDAGRNGVNGHNGLVSVVPEPAGTNCPNGGVKITTGLDNNDNGTLDSSEVTATQYVCSASGGGSSSLVKVSQEAAGANCAQGGAKIESGPDTNGNGMLDTSEVTSTNYVCNGGGGQATLTAVQVEPAGANCVAGGAKIQTGTDTNGNGMLDASEVTSTNYVCNGDAGAANGTMPVITQYGGVNSEVTSTNSAPVTITMGSLAAPGVGTLLAIGDVEVFCSAAGMPACGASTPHDGYVTITNDATGTPTGGNASYFYVNPDVSSHFSRTAVFPVTAAGTQTIYLRGQAGAGTLGFFRGQLTLVFIPHS